ncbi:MAG TPA: glycosyltransferase family 4 protein [Candidatus Limnocylindria bacterium]|nr:glycosyltransferase family 4 protein [Candidatus Limnocylindria bacterium]
MTHPKERQLPPPESLRRLDIQVERIRHRPPSKVVALVRGVVGPLPYTLSRYHSPELEAELARLEREVKPDLIYIDHLHLAWIAHIFPDSVRVLREHNVEYLFLERYARTARNPLVRAYALAQARKMRDTERALCNRMHLVLAIQAREAEALREIGVSTRVEVIPIGIDFAAYSPRHSGGPPTILLAASYAWSPNVDGAMRFIREGWPWVRSRVPNVRLRVVGKALPPRMARAARVAGAESVGYVPSMADEFAKASLLVVPLWTGAGARVRIVEAMAASLPVVSTPLGAEGLGLEPSVHVRLGDTPMGLGEAILDLLMHPEQGDRMAQVAHVRARESFSIEIVARRTVDVCRQAVANHRIA